VEGFQDLLLSFKNCSDRCVLEDECVAIAWTGPEQNPEATALCTGYTQGDGGGQHIEGTVYWFYVPDVDEETLVGHPASTQQSEEALTEQQCKEWFLQKRSEQVEEYVKYVGNWKPAVADPTTFVMVPDFSKPVTMVQAHFLPQNASNAAAECNHKCLTWDGTNLVMEKCAKRPTARQLFGKSVKGFTWGARKCLVQDPDSRLATMLEMPKTGESPCPHLDKQPWRRDGQWSVLLQTDSKELCMESCEVTQISAQISAQIGMRNLARHTESCGSSWSLIPTSEYKQPTMLDGSQCGGFVGSWLRVSDSTLVELVLNSDHWGTATYHLPNVTSGEPYLVYLFEVVPTMTPCGIRLYWYNAEGLFMAGHLTNPEQITWDSPGGIWQKVAEPKGTCTVKRYETTTSTTVLRAVIDSCSSGFEGEWLQTRSATEGLVHIYATSDTEGKAVFLEKYSYPVVFRNTSTGCELTLYEGGVKYSLPKVGVLNGDILNWKDSLWGYWTKGAGVEACDVCSNPHFPLGGDYRCYSPMGGACLLAPDRQSCQDVVPHATWCPPGSSDSVNFV